MKTLLQTPTATAVVAGVLVPAIADAHPHRVCHFWHQRCAAGCVEQRAARLKTSAGMPALASSDACGEFADARVSR